MRNDYTDYLMHRDHKYLSREWVKGKWQYIYDEKLGGKQKHAMVKAKSELNGAESDIKLRNKRLKDHNGSYSPGELLTPESQRRYDNAASDLKDKKKDYDKTVLGKIDKVKEGVDKLSGGALSKVHEAKFNKRQDDLKRERELGYAKEARQKANDDRTRQFYKRNDYNQTKVQIKLREQSAANDAKAKTEEQRKHYVEEVRPNANKKANDTYRDAKDKSQKEYHEAVEAWYKDKSSEKLTYKAEINKFRTERYTDLYNDANKRKRTTDAIAEISKYGDPEDIGKYMTQMVSDPYSASPEFWEELASNMKRKKG